MKTCKDYDLNICPACEHNTDTKTIFDYEKTDKDRTNHTYGEDGLAIICWLIFWKRKIFSFKNRIQIISHYESYITFPPNLHSYYFENAIRIFYPEHDGLLNAINLLK